MILGAHTVLLDPEEGTLYLATERRQGGIAIFRRNSSTGKLTQPPGRRGCIAITEWEDCGITRRISGTHFAAFSNDGRFIYIVAEKSNALVALKVPASER
jgi:6-phosphogluconolactonase (cycloisomerase 2 family)